MIRSFRDRRTRALFDGERVSAFHSFAEQAERRLRILDAVETLDALRALPSNRFEALVGDRKGRFSIRINRQWRVCLVWRQDGAHEVEIIDYR